MTESRRPPRTCPSCGGDLSSLPADIMLCPYCGKKLAPTTQPKPARKALGITTMVLAVAFPLMVFLLGAGKISLIWLFHYGIHTVLVFACGLYIALSTKYSSVGSAIVTVCGLAALFLPPLTGAPILAMFLIMAVLTGFHPEVLLMIPLSVAAVVEVVAGILLRTKRI